MRLIAFGPRFLGLRWGVSLGRRDLEKIFSGGAAKRPFDPDTGSFIYVMRGEHGRVKIGVTSNCNERLAQLQTGSHCPLEFAWIGAPQGQALGIEYDAHEMLASYRESGEWFRVAPDAAVGAISAAAQRRGVNILGCTPELAELIRQVGSSPSKPRKSLWISVAAIAVWIFVVIIIIWGIITSTAPPSGP